MSGSEVSTTQVLVMHGETCGWRSSLSNGEEGSGEVGDNDEESERQKSVSGYTADDTRYEDSV